MDFEAFIDKNNNEDEAELFFEGPDADTPAAPQAQAKPAVTDIDLDFSAFDMDVPTGVPPQDKAAATPAPAPAGDLPDFAAFDMDMPAATPPQPSASSPAQAAAPAAPAVAGPATTVIHTMPRPVQITLVLAVFASLLSAIGLIVVSRNLAVLAEQRHEVEQRAAAFARLPGLLAEVEALAARQKTELARASARYPSALVTPGELANQLNSLRYAISKSQPAATTALAGVVRQGQVELAHRIDQMGDRIDKVEGRRAEH